MMTTVGVVVFFIPGMKHLERCLKSVEWADDMVVVKIDEAVAPNRKRTDWVLHLWGQELVEDELREQLLALRENPLSESRLSYKIAVRSYLLGRWVDGSLWGPSPSLRLVREIRSWPPAWWNASEWESEKESASLSGKIRDDSTAELAFGINQVNRVASLWAEVSNSHGQVPSLGTTNFSSLRLFLRLLAKPGLFHKGFAGLTLSVLTAYAALLGGAKSWEKANRFSGRMNARETSEGSMP